jgi:L-lactate dehydrogenase (cytochrome)
VLPAIVDALAGAMPLLVDGGVRTGLDMFRMLALGADAVLLGRAWLFALAAGGEAEVLRMLRSMETELRVAMALAGCVRGSIVQLR